VSDPEEDEELLLLDDDDEELDRDRWRWEAPLL
jgi:hypothetical protein